MDCIFCNIVEKKAPSWTVYQDEYISAFFDYFPASKGHILIVPNEHYENLHETPDEILGKIISLSKKIANFYKDEMGIKNINIHQSNGKLAGQEVFHYHIHLIPRTPSDEVHFKWEADESLRNEYDELREFISKKIV